MGVLAWLMLVVSSLSAAPMGMTGSSDALSVNATVTAVIQHSRSDAGADLVTCCGGNATQACHCVAMCSATLPSLMAIVPAPSELTVSYGMLLTDGAPSLVTTPPWRPPAA